MKNQVELTMHQLFHLLYVNKISVPATIIEDESITKVVIKRLAVCHPHYVAISDTKGDVYIDPVVMVDPDIIKQAGLNN